MARFPLYDVVRDGTGKVVSGATVAFKVHSTGATATVYASETGGTPLSGGQTTTGDDGLFIVWADSADYAVDDLFEVSISKIGYTTTTKVVKS